MSLGNRKLVVLGIPWDADTEALREYMSKFGELDDVIVMKDRATGRSRGFGYVTFTSPESKVASTQHTLNGRPLDVKVATPKEEMKPPSKKITRVFVARIPPSVTDEMFRNYFQKYGTIIDAYMPKDHVSKAHRGIGFVTYDDSESVDKLMSETHEMAGSTIAVDRATPKEETTNLAKALAGAYGAYGLYTQAARFGAFGGFGLPPFGAFDYANATYPGPGFAGSSFTGVGLGNDLAATGAVSAYGMGNPWQTAPPLSGTTSELGIGATGTNPAAGYGSVATPAPAPAPTPKIFGNKIFVGRLPPEATSEDLRRYFSNFGRIMDVYIPKDAKKTSHRGFGFVTFADESAAERVSLRTHEILGHQIAVDRAAPAGESPPDAAFLNNPTSGAAGSIRGSTAVSSSGYGALPGSIDISGGWGSYGTTTSAGADGALPGAMRTSRAEPRYRPY
ncbi:hypothetical protein O6H91_12G049300 [Diphasiastrum complanatum]|uniref:Uncharacterized protein n=1 Tax=Diphasiastrum complanatum TaxID=34168 RepID=A0ACC2C1J4_DIPCM|nr:hypothetical protein O6H91_12G049300 [Diphasiastrum complanatum]